MENNSFESLDLNENLLKGVYLYGFTKPSKIQITGVKSISTITVRDGENCNIFIRYIK
jgi:superfamily II DNA/RNA helicase